MTFVPGDVPPRRPKPKAGASSKPSRSRDEPRPEVGGPSWLERLVFGVVSTGHLARFCRQFASYTEAGVDLLKSLSSLEKQFAKTALGPVLARIQVAVRQGDALGDAMAREPRAFDPLFLSMIRVAEARGGVPETLRAMADHYEARLRLLRQARSAMIYPVIVLIVATGVIALLTLFVLPAMIKGLELKQAAMPLPTRAVIAFSDFMQAIGWWAVPLALVGGGFVLVRWYRTPIGKRTLDELFLYVPVLGKLLRKLDTTRFARTLSTLLGSGVDVGSSLDLTADVMVLAPYKRVVRGARVAVLEGSELSAALDASRRFDRDVIAIVESGEESGRLPESLEKLADDYEEQVAYMVKNLGSLIQPLIMIALGLLVLFIILAVVLPYISWILTMSRGG